MEGEALDKEECYLQVEEILGVSDALLEEPLGTPYPVETIAEAREGPVPHVSSRRRAGPGFA
ncbi:MAG: hypothetical protein F4Z29_04155 [Gemmatimonadetes bacterium]|nr:hypothetical protein [Gemmatimonadota bacterium]